MGRFSDAVEKTAEYYYWQVPGKPVSVHFSVRAASRVLAGAGRGLGARLETGGLLLGCAGAGPGVAVTVENVLEVPIEYASGPIYRLSERDKENLRITLRLWERSPGRSIYAVGFYRTQARAGLSLAPSDLELFSEFFPEPYCVALLIRPQPRRAALAGLFYRENGEVTAVPGCLELPLRHEKSEPAPAPEPEPPACEPESAVLAFRPRSAVWASWWIQGPLLAALLLVDGFLGFLAAFGPLPAPPARRAPPRDPYALSLLVVESDQNLHLMWDRDAPALAQASGAVLSITDDGETRTLDVPLAQLREGSITYRRNSGSVTFRLEVFLKNRRSLSETWSLEPAP
ncbi:MAG TPA: hypothetical protein PLP04_06180 [Bryobacteraceae bacterium]|nr:hypothetical protein [Bryobacteraceae bacterium]